MLSTNEVIVLSLQAHSDKAQILHTYTRTGGRVNYKVYGIGRRNTSGKYSPLSILQVTNDSQSIRTAQLAYVPQTIVNDPYKRTIALFISEVLYHVLRHPMEDEPMYDFLVQAIEGLDQTDAPQNYHLRFLVDFAAKLGFAIPEEEKINLSPENRKDRQESLKLLCAYFAEHVETWQTPRSIEILAEVFD